MKYALNKQWERDSDHAWKKHSMAAKRRRADEDKMQIESDIAQHHVDESDFNIAMMHVLNHFSDLICQLRNLLNASSELPAGVMIDLKQVYRQWNCHEAAFMSLWTKAWMEVFQYRVLRANSSKQRRKNEMPLTKAPFIRMMKTPWREIPLNTWPSGVQCEKGSYRITLLGVSRDLPTSHTMSITISISVSSTMQHTFGRMQ